MSESVKENQLDESIKNKIDESLKKKEDERNNNKDESIINEVSSKYEEKIKEMESKFEEKFNSMSEKFNQNLSEKDKELQKAKEDLEKTNDSINQRKSLTADDAPQNNKPKSHEEYREWYRSLPNSEKSKVDQEFFNAKLARHSAYNGR